ncbi:MAG: type II toxin-antitoxin system VapC family toxin [Propionibacteriaceae bacterium]|jgi:predicted nucleic acid-binding protein|nr:type II toxin-antitoxin system VapC family toxin [Propionibacteriaceae bacterium]
MIVVDASVWVRALTDDNPLGAACRQVMASDPEWAMPAHVRLEVLRALHKLTLAGVLDVSRADGLAREVCAATIITAATAALLHRAWQLLHHLSAYDAAYVALAERFGVPCLTTDVRLANAARGLAAEVRLVEAPSTHLGESDRAAT